MEMGGEAASERVEGGEGEWPIKEREKDRGSEGIGGKGNEGRAALTEGYCCQKLQRNAGWR